MTDITTAIILASGVGERFGDNQPKQFMKLAGLPVLVHTLKVFQSHPGIDRIVVTTNEDYVDHVWSLVTQYGLSKVFRVVAGGATRQESSQIGLISCGEDTAHVLIHDGVRPFLSHQVIDRLLEAVAAHGAVDTVIPSADTLVEVTSEGFIRNIPDRSTFRRGQTPQAFAYPLIVDAHRRAREDGIENATDDCALTLRLGHSVYTVEGDEQNIKITYPLDLHLADKLFQLHSKVPAAGIADSLHEVFEGKTVVVIGGSSGIGAALVEQLKAYAADVYSLSRTTSPAVDVNSPDGLAAALKNVVEQSGGIDYVVNCAGDLIRKPVENTTLDEWTYIYDVNLTGNFNLAKALVPIFRSQNGGRLMMIGSSSYTRGRSGYAAYSSSKAALVNFCQAVSEEVSSFNMKINVFSPGRVNTPLRFRNFGKEDPSTLLDVDYVGRQLLLALAVDTTGSVFEVSN